MDHPIACSTNGLVVKLGTLNSLNHRIRMI